MKNALIIFLGGGLGSVVRYLAYLFMPTSAGQFPLSTFIVNVIGSFLIGFFFAKEGLLSQNSNALFLFLATGFCGGFTTFSTFSKESVILLQNQQWTTFLAYVSLSLALCLGGTAFGFFVGK